VQPLSRRPHPFGSNCFNLFIVFVLDAAYRRGPVLLGVASGLVVPVVGGILLIALAGLALAYNATGGADSTHAAPGIGLSAAIVIAYLSLARMSAKAQLLPDTSEQFTEDTPKTDYTYTTTRIFSRLAIYAVLLIAAAVWLLNVCDAVAVTPFSIGSRQVVLHQTVTGSLVLAAATSFPELFVCMALLRFGQINMAIANLLGSNMANMLLLPVMHAATGRADFYSQIPPQGDLVLIFAAILMSALLIFGILSRSRKAILGVGREPLLIFIVYVVAAGLVVQSGLRF